MVTATEPTSPATTYIVRDGKIERVPDRGYWREHRTKVSSGGREWWEIEQVFVSPARWEDYEVDVQAYGPCPTGHAEVWRLTNYGHPTELLVCNDCDGQTADYNVPPCESAECWCKKSDQERAGA